MTKPATLDDSQDFSLVLGGPLYQLFKKAHLSGPTLELLRRRILFFSLITWGPLAVLSAIGGQLWSSDHLGFLRDLETQIRFLVALPVLILAELTVHQRIRPLAKRFVERGVIASEDRPRFHAAIGTALRLRNSVGSVFWPGAVTLSLLCSLPKDRCFQA